MKRAFAILLAMVLVSGCAGTRAVPDWTEAPWGPFHLVDPPGIQNPVLTAADVTDRDAQFLADPFLFQEGDAWYMFFEILDRQSTQGDIGLAASPDGLTWEYQQVVLDEPFHLSYPYVFKVNQTYYMIPESHQPKDVRLYEADSFPTGWRYVATLVTGRNFVDPSLVFRDGRWWMFVGDADNTTLYLFLSKRIDRGWEEHPLSPIIRGDSQRARPGGRAFTYDGGRLIRLAQSNDAAGQSVRAFEVDVLDPRQYSEHEIPESPLLERGSSSEDWLAGGMHQLDPWWTGTGWLAVVDGRDSSENYSIGIRIAEEPAPKP